MDIALLLLIFGTVTLAVTIYCAAKALYQRGFEVGREATLSADELRIIHWLANIGFHRLLSLGESGSGGFHKRPQAETAHHALDRLASYLPEDAVKDRDMSFDRMSAISMCWRDETGQPAHDLADDEVWNELEKGLGLHSNSNLSPGEAAQITSGKAAA